MNEQEANETAERHICSFCRKSPAQVGPLIEGPEMTIGVRAYICLECVELCTMIFKRRRLERAAEGEATASTQRIEVVLTGLTCREWEIIKLRRGLGRSSSG
jgi:hypothetical protein